MTTDEVLEIIRMHGSEASIRAILSFESQADVQRQLAKHKAVFGKLVDILEKKKVLRRGNIVSLLCAAQGIKDGG